METLTGPLIFYRFMAESDKLKEVAEAAEAAKELLAKHAREFSMCPDVYRAKVNAKTNIETMGCDLNSEERRLVEKMMLEGKRHGLELTDEKRKELVTLQQELSETCAEFRVSFSSGSLSYLLKVWTDRQRLWRATYALSY